MNGWLLICVGIVVFVAGGFFYVIGEVDENKPTLSRRRLILVRTAWIAALLLSVALIGVGAWLLFVEMDPVWVVVL